MLSCQLLVANYEFFRLLLAILCPIVHDRIIMKNLPKVSIDLSLFKKVFLPILLVFSLASSILAGFFFVQYQQAKKTNPEIEVKRVVEKVSRLIELPGEETPTLATVSDKGKLSEQEFFSKAENGDKVLVYLKAGKAVLYRPNLNKIIDVAPIRNLEQPPAEEKVAGVTDAQENPTISLYNGTFISGLTKQAESIITEASSEYEIAARKNASLRNYTQSIVYDASGTHATEAQDLANLFNAQISGSLPDGEQQPSSDLLLIIGRDFGTPSSAPTQAETPVETTENP